MRRILIPAVFVLLFFLPALAQENSAPLPAGVRFPAQLLSKLNSHKSKVGDDVKLEVTANLRGPGGVIALPQGAKLIGTITAVKPHTGDAESELAFLVTRAEWHGGSMALHAVPTAVTSLRMRTEHEGGAMQRPNSGGGEGRSRGDSGDTVSLLAQAMAREIKGVEVRDSGDPKIGTAFFQGGHDVSLPTGVIITLRQTEATPQ